jgi:hypothetical protein
VGFFKYGEQERLVGLEFAAEWEEDWAITERNNRFGGGDDNLCFGHCWFVMLLDIYVEISSKELVMNIGVQKN